MEGLFWGGCCALAIFQPPLQLCSFQEPFPPQEDHSNACERTSTGCGGELSLCCFPRPFWALAMLLWLWVYVRVTSTAKYWGFQLAALACVGEGRARGQIRTGFPHRCLIWLLRSGMCFALLFWFVPSEVSEVGLAGQAMLRMAAPARGRRQELTRTGAATFRVPARSESPIHFYFLGFSPSQFPPCVLWSMYSTQLVTLGQIKFSGAFLGPLRF